MIRISENQLGIRPHSTFCLPPLQQPTITNKLLWLPIFQGFSRLDFLDVIEKTPLEFLKFKSGQTIVNAHEECRHLYVITEGKVDVRLHCPSEGYDYHEEIEAPFVVQPDHLFGLHNNFTRTIQAEGAVQAVRIEKRWVHELARTHVAFQLNLINIVCTESQRLNSMLTACRPEDIERRFSLFLRSRSLSPSGRKRLHMRMVDLSHALGTSRLEVSRMLHNLQSRYLLLHSRQIISIPFLEMLP